MNRLIPVRTAVGLSSRRDPKRIHPIGTAGCIVETIGDPDVDPMYLVELRIDDTALVGGAWYEVFELRAHEFCDA